VSNTTCSSLYTVTTNVGVTPSTSCVNAVAANYSFSYVNGYVTVSQRRVVVTASTPTVFYGSPVPTIGFSLTNMANGQDHTVFSTQPTCTTVYTVTDVVGARPATSCTGAVADNYWFVYTDAYVDIQPAIITITASSHTRVYGETSVPTVSATYTGWQNGNSESILTTLATCATNYTNLSTVAGGAHSSHAN
jgi:hypothetical protein